VAAAPPNLRFAVSRSVERGELSTEGPVFHCEIFFPENGKAHAFLSLGFPARRKEPSLSTAASVFRAH